MRFFKFNSGKLNVGIKSIFLRTQSKEPGKSVLLKKQYINRYKDLRIENIIYQA